MVVVCFCADLHSHAQCLEVEELAAMSVNPSLLPTLNDLLLKVYTVLRPKAVDYEQRNTLVDVFNEMTNKIFGTFLQVLLLSNIADVIA